MKYCKLSVRFISSSCQSTKLNCKLTFFLIRFAFSCLSLSVWVRWRNWPLVAFKSKSTNNYGIIYFGVQLIFRMCAFSLATGFQRCFYARHRLQQTTSLTTVQPCMHSLIQICTHTRTLGWGKSGIFYVCCVFDIDLKLMRIFMHGMLNMAIIYSWAPTPWNKFTTHSPSLHRCCAFRSHCVSLSIRCDFFLWRR